MSERTDELLINDIFDSINAIINYTSDINEDDFLIDRKTQDAVSRNFSIIGEAASRLSESFKQSHTSVNWREIKDFRNKLIHDYFGVNPDIVWNIIQNDLPVLKITIFQIMQSFKQNS
jgi:uncharacterized protein with HEPN domain